LANTERTNEQTRSDMLTSMTPKAKHSASLRSEKLLKSYPNMSNNLTSLTNSQRKVSYFILSKSPREEVSNGSQPEGTAVR